jgi:DNA invertase Pin-like site-specific DNA recombinase
VPASSQRAALYARVSTDEQVEGTSLGTQLTSGRAWCALNGYEVGGEYVDEGESGQTQAALASMRCSSLYAPGGSQLWWCRR